MQKTVDTIEDFESRLEGWVTDIENKISEVNTRPDTTLPAVDTHSFVVSKLNDTELALMNRISVAESVLTSEATKLKEATLVQTGASQALMTKVNNTRK